MMNTIRLHDSVSGSEAKILASLGFNAYSFRPVVAGRSTEVLWSAPAFESGRERPSGSGIPLLFPFAGRLRGTSFTFEGRPYTLEPGDALGNAIHGFVFNRPWRVIEQTALAVTGEFQASVDDASILDHWPSDFRIRAHYELGANTLTSVFEITNPGTRRLPFGFGTHPYFRVPLGDGLGADSCQVTVPVREHWPLADMLPTGEHEPLSSALARGMPFGEMHFDDVFSGVEHVGGHARATIVDATHARTLTLTFDDGFDLCVVYNPGHREAVCIEPYTCLPDAYTMAERGIATGLRVLEPGATARYRVEMRLDKS